MKNPNSLTIPLGNQRTSAVTTALVYSASAGTGTGAGTGASAGAATETDAETDEGANPPGGATLILGHGAGAGQNSAFMVDFALALSALGVDVVTFNFPYMERRGRIPDRGPVLEACFRSVIEIVRHEVGSARTALFAGGKSMGGRIATQVAAANREIPLAGLVLLGYPLHPPGRPDERRDKHLGSVSRPMLFVQGSRDAFGTPVELAPVLETLDPPAALHVVEGGDHSFKLTRRDPAAQARVYATAQQAIANWIGSARAVAR